MGYEELSPWSMKNFNTFLRNDLFEISIGKLSESCLSTSVVDIRKKGTRLVVL